MTKQFIHLAKKRVKPYMLRFFEKKYKIPERCLICGGARLEKSFIHCDWYKRCYKCLSCGHVALYNSENNAVPQNHFFTLKERADEQLNIIKNKKFISILEVGAPPDLYFLKELHKYKPLVGKFTYDIFPYNPLLRHI